MTERALAAARAAELPRWLLPVATFAGALALLVARVPHSIFRAEFWSDDGMFYDVALDHGLASVFETYSGYLMIGNRLLSIAETAVPPPLAPLLSNLVALVGMAAVGVYLVTARLPWSRRRGTIMALTFVLVAANQEVVGSASHLIWAGAAWMGLVALSQPPERRVGRAIEAAGLAFVGLSTPFALLLLPIYVGGPRYRLAAVGVTAVLQVLAALYGHTRPAPGPLEIELLPYATALRGLVTPTLGPTLAALLPGMIVVLLAIAVAGGLVLALMRLPRPLAWRLVFVAGVPAAVGLLTLAGGTASALHPLAGVRYFWLTAVVIAWLLVLTFRASSPTSVVLTGLVAIGMAVDFRHEPPPFMNWAQESVCIGGSAACEAQVAPRLPGNEDQWTVTWDPHRARADAD